MLKIKGGRCLFPHLYYDLLSIRVLLVVDECVRREVEDVWVGPIAGGLAPSKDA